MRLINILAQAIEAEQKDYAVKCLDRCVDLLPSGSGFNAGCRVDLEKSTPTKIIINTSYHHMNDAGFYDGWTEHKVILTPLFNGYDIHVTGRDRNGIKEYIGFTFAECLDSEVDL